jgi:hypothetical protein
VRGASVTDVIRVMLHTLSEAVIDGQNRHNTQKVQNDFSGVLARHACPAGVFSRAFPIRLPTPTAFVSLTNRKTVLGGSTGIVPDVDT